MDSLCNTSGMKELLFQLTSARLAAPTRPSSPRHAFAQTADLLVQLKSHSPEQLLPGLLDSRQIKEQLLFQLTLIASVPDAEVVRRQSLQALAAGLFCGAVDGAILYAVGVTPEPIRAAEQVGSADISAETLSRLEVTLEAMEQSIQVADRQWRQLDSDGLQLQAGYGKHLNRSTQEENVHFLGQPGRGPGDARRALAETFRTGYSLGLIDSAIVFLTDETPDPMPP